MNPEILLQDVAQKLRKEAQGKTGTLYLCHEKGKFVAKSHPFKLVTTDIIERFDTEEFNKGLTSKGWSDLLKKILNRDALAQKGKDVEQPPKGE